MEDRKPVEFSKTAKDELWPEGAQSKALNEQLAYWAIAALAGGAGIGAGIGGIKHLMEGPPKQTLRPKTKKLNKYLGMPVEEPPGKKEAQMDKQAILGLNAAGEAISRFFMGGDRPEFLPTVATGAVAAGGGLVGYKVISDMIKKHREKERLRKIEDVRDKYLASLSELSSLNKQSSEYDFTAMVNDVADYYLSGQTKQANIGILPGLAVAATGVGALSFLLARHRSKATLEKKHQKAVIEDLRRRRMLMRPEDITTIQSPESALEQLDQEADALV